MTAVADTRPAEAGPGTLPPPGPPEDRAIEELAGALDGALAAVAGLEADARRVADGLRTALEDTHRAALVHVIRTLRADERGKELLFAMVDEP
ncbi:MAG TPA: hypothetical protein VNC22_15630, partial [Sporichthya sp.]|nr:hypothetical protein [Sporichthya sp.]